MADAQKKAGDDAGTGDDNLSGDEILARDMENFDAGEASNLNPGDAEPAKKSDAKRMSKEDWVKSGRAEEDYLSEAEFNRVADLKDQNHLELSRNFVRVESLLNKTIKGQEKLANDAFERGKKETITDLKAQQDVAIEADDTKKALEIEREITKETAKKPEAVADDSAGPDDAVLAHEQQQWNTNNSHWYGVDQSATNLLNVELTRAEKDGLPFMKGIERAEAKVKKHFPYYFDDAGNDDTGGDDDTTINKTTTKPRHITEKNRKPGDRTTDKKKTFADLPEEVREVAQRSAKTSGLTEEEYMKSYEAM